MLLRVKDRKKKKVITVRHLGLRNTNYMPAGSSYGCSRQIWCPMDMNHAITGSLIISCPTLETLRKKRGPSLGYCTRAALGQCGTGIQIPRREQATDLPSPNPSRPLIAWSAHPLPLLHIRFTIHCIQSLNTA